MNELISAIPSSTAGHLIRDGLRVPRIVLRSDEEAEELNRKRAQKFAKMDLISKA